VTNKKNQTTIYTLLFIILFSFVVNINFQNFWISNNFQDPSSNDNNLYTSIRKDWEETLNYGGNDEGQSIVSDSLGNVYITGKGYNASKSCYDIIIAKYNNSGSLKWSRTWGGTSDDLGYGISLDTSNNVYVTGWTASYSNGSYDIVLLKCNSSGDFEWNRTWGGAGWDSGYALTVDTNNKIFVCGYSESYEPNGNIVLMKYDNQGNLEWNRTWGDNTTDLAYGITNDLQGNLYITGYTDDNTSTYTDLLIMKYNNSGDLVWNTTWGGALQEEGWDLVFDGNDTIYIAGGTKSYGGGGYNAVILAYNKSGQLLWNNTWGGAQNDFGYGISLNLENELFVIGTTKSFGDAVNGDFYLLKYNTSGYEIWNRTWGDASVEMV